jgi:hypothetical protein
MKPQTITIVLFREKYERSALASLVQAYATSRLTLINGLGKAMGPMIYDVEEGSAEIINVGSSAGINSGPSKLVFSLRIGSQVYDLVNKNKSQINQLRPVSQPPLSHKSCGRNEGPQLKE